MNAIVEGRHASAEETADETPARCMEFVGKAAGALSRGLFNTVRVGYKWADLSVGEMVCLACTEVAGGLAHDYVDAMVVHVATGEVRDLVRGHSAMNLSTRDEGNPETRDLELGLELRRHYGMGPDVATKVGTVVYLVPDMQEYEESGPVDEG